ncbi:Polyunsaturated fatty acid lipoxygenase ALOX15 [Lemmus lemmus]
MGVFCIRVSSGCSLYAGSKDKVHLWLVGEHGEASLRMLLRPLHCNSVSFTELRLGCALILVEATTQSDVVGALLVCAPFLSGFLRLALPVAQWKQNSDLDTPSCAPWVCLQEVEFQVDVSEHLGPLLFVKVQKLHYLLDDAWFCNWISVKGPGDQGAEYRFPCYR